MTTSFESEGTTFGLKHHVPIKTYQPTVEQMKEPLVNYIDLMEADGAHLAGIAKIVPPEGYSEVMTQDWMEFAEFPIYSKYIQKDVSGKDGAFTMTIRKKELSLKVKDILPDGSYFSSRDKIDPTQLWKNFEEKKFVADYYSDLDVPKKFEDSDFTMWNLDKLHSILDDTAKDIAGVTSSFAYFGTPGSCFGWHVEDMELYSVNYLKYGGPKYWNSVPPAHGRQFERVAATLFPTQNRNCSYFLKHKRTMISPSTLRHNGVPVGSITQNAGEYIVTFPYGYHSGHNSHLNCALAINFATRRWLEYGKYWDFKKKCGACPDDIGIDMAPLIKKYQTDVYEEWRKSNHFAFHPEDVYSGRYVGPRRNIDCMKKSGDCDVFGTDVSLPSSIDTATSSDRNTTKTTTMEDMGKCQANEDLELKSISSETLDDNSFVTNIEEDPSLQDWLIAEYDLCDVHTHGSWETQSTDMLTPVVSPKAASTEVNQFEGISEISKPTPSLTTIPSSPKLQTTDQWQYWQHESQPDPAYQNSVTLPTHILNTTHWANPTQTSLPTSIPWSHQQVMTKEQVATLNYQISFYYACLPITITLMEREKKKRRPYACSHCGNRFQRTNHLKDHIRTHTGERPFTCPDCPLRFKTRSQLKQHNKKKNVHQEEKK